MSFKESSLTFRSVARHGNLLSVGRTFRGFDESDDCGDSLGSSAKGHEPASFALCVRNLLDDPDQYCFFEGLRRTKLGVADDLFGLSARHCRRSLYALADA